MSEGMKQAELLKKGAKSVAHLGLKAVADTMNEAAADLDTLTARVKELETIADAAQEYADEQTVKILPAIIPVGSKLHKLIEALHARARLAHRGG